MPGLQVADMVDVPKPGPLYVYSGGFLSQGRVRRILELAGWDIRLGKPGREGWVGVWGKSPTSGRGEAVAQFADAKVLRVEDSFLRSLHPGRAGEPPLGLNIDTRGVHFDSAQPSDLENLLANHGLDDTALLNRARNAMARIRDAHLSKYNAFDPQTVPPEAPYVLVIDQTVGDASIKYGGSNAATFAEMLVFAQTENPGSRIVIKAHPEVTGGFRQGHFSAATENDRISYVEGPISPWSLLEGATAVYTVSSQMGFEAILAGHRPRVFGQPFYAGWGLSVDEYPVARRMRKLTRAQLFAAAMFLYPTWYDPYRDRICQLEDVIDTLEAEARTWRADNGGYVACGMRRWKRRFLRQFFGTNAVEFVTTGDTAVKTAKRQGRELLVWAKFAHELPDQGAVDVIRVEDGFLRSRGLGAKLVAPHSLVADNLGIYYDPSRESRLEQLIAQSVNLPPYKIERIDRVLTRIRRAKLSKYNISVRPLDMLPPGHKILVPGQVEDDASVLLGCSDIRTNIDLLSHTRAQNPEAVIIYKPHPDVSAGLRKGNVEAVDALKYADLVLDKADPVALIDAVDEVWTMTSTLGFEALIRECRVTCLGVPFYGGWGLTQDVLRTEIRRKARPTLAMLAHACLIDYPRYLDPVTGRPCPIEVALDRLESGEIYGRSQVSKVLASLQSAMQAFIPLWRR